MLLATALLVIAVGSPLHAGVGRLASEATGAGMTTKADYVRSQVQTRGHHCHWPGCEKQVPPAMWGCKGHWFALPPMLRARIWRTYKPGQEVLGTPSAEYVAAAKMVQAWIAEHERLKPPNVRAKRV